MMGVYLELMKSIPERRARLLMRHSEFVKRFSETVEDLRQRLAGPPP
jgi:hypothetical protein